MAPVSAWDPDAGLCVCRGSQDCRAGFAGRDMPVVRATDASLSLPDPTQDAVLGRLVQVRRAGQQAHLPWRVDEAWPRVLRLAAATEGHVAVVTHGLVCGAIFLRHLDSTTHDAPERWGNTALTIIEAPRTVRLLACTAHLE